MQGAPQTEYAELKDETLAERTLREALAARPPRATFEELVASKGPRIVYDTTDPDHVAQALRLGFNVYVAGDDCLLQLHKRTIAARSHALVRFYMAAPTLRLDMLMQATNTKNVRYFHSHNCLCITFSETFDPADYPYYHFRT